LWIFAKGHVVWNAVSIVEREECEVNTWGLFRI
jgi:hypothetical protein